MKKETTSSAVDRRALQVLYNTYWTSTGWRDERSRCTPPSDFQYAKRAGVMFDSVLVSHDDIVERVLFFIRQLDRQTVANAFVVSISNRRLDLRSALGSFAVFQHFARHPAPPDRRCCPICGEYGAGARQVDLNILNFERFKWGGVRHDQPLYASLDLELFRKQACVTICATDVALFKKLLKAIETSSAETTSATLQKNLARVLKSSKAERDVVVGILGYCGILATSEHPGYRQRFVPLSERVLPERRFADMSYPACWWKRSDGINREALDYWFGHLL